ncbi:MAG: hypothetical protein IKJ13_05600 [Clostridia bacterium]|nr:hypothetical protein [Clostridia bacterium]
MSAYKRNTAVNIHDVDFNGIAKTSAIMRYIQSAAQDQLTANGMSYDELKLMNRAFILARLNLEILEPLRAYTPLTALSYPTESRGYSFLRCYELLCDGRTVARAISAWALIDTKTRALVKVNDFNLGLPILKGLDLPLPRITLPSEIADVGGYGVHYGDVDQNMHMNNTKYPDMYSNYLPLVGKRISKIAISYSAEAKIGEKLRVLRANRGNIYYFKTIKSDGKTNSEAEIEIVDI